MLGTSDTIIKPTVFVHIHTYIHIYIYMYMHTYIQADLILRISTFLVVIFSKRLLALPTKGRILCLDSL
jgi:hypothetical protein